MVASVQPPKIAVRRRQLLLQLPLCLLLTCTGACTPYPGTAGAHAGTEVDPTALAAAVRERLLKERDSELSDLDVKADNQGIVTLSGRTYTQAKADRAQQIARTTPGVTRVRNSIQALPATPR